MSVLDDVWTSLDARALAAVPFYCEENVFRILSDPRLPAPVEHRAAVFVTNPARAVAMWSQLAAAVDPVVWDYHVVVVVRGAGVVVDVDCTRGAVLSVDDWVAASFRAGVPDEVLPWFRVVDAPTFLRVFSSDRSHMLDAHGRPTQPPPPWPAPHHNGPMNLLRFVDLDDDVAGVVCDLRGFVSFAKTPPPPPR